MRRDRPPASDGWDGRVLAPADDTAEADESAALARALALTDDQDARVRAALRHDDPHGFLCRALGFHATVAVAVRPDDPGRLFVDVSVQCVTCGRALAFDAPAAPAPTGSAAGVADDRATAFVVPVRGWAGGRAAERGPAFAVDMGGPVVAAVRPDAADARGAAPAEAGHDGHDEFWGLGCWRCGADDTDTWCAPGERPACVDVTACDRRFGGLADAVAAASAEREGNDRG